MVRVRQTERTGDGAPGQRCADWGEWPGAVARLLDPRNGPAWDLATPTTSPRAFVVAGAPRCGSTFLCRLLEQAGPVGRPGEWLAPVPRRDWALRFGSCGWGVAPPPVLPLVARVASPGRLRDHLRRVRARRSATWFGLKLIGTHLLGTLRGDVGLLEELLGPLRWVRLVRDARHDQALSLARALWTGEWEAAAPHPEPPRPPRWLVRRAQGWIEDQERAWDRTLAGRRPFLLRYEELDEDPRTVTRKVLSFLDVDPTHAVDPARTGCARQRPG